MFASKISTVYGVKSSVINNSISAFRVNSIEGGEGEKKKKKGEKFLLVSYLSRRS